MSKYLASVAALIFALGLAVTNRAAWAFEFDGPFPTRDYPFEVKDSGVEVQVDAATVVGWLDNEQVIFSALKPGEPRLQGAVFHANRKPQNAPGRVVMWNTRNGEVKQYSEGKLACSHGGFVSIWYDVTDSITGKTGSRTRTGYLGREEDKRAWQPGDPVRHRDWHTCLIYDGPPKKPAPDHWVFNLREEDGFLAVGLKGKPNNPKDPVILIRPDGTRQLLPITWPEVQGAWWNDWAGVYLLAQMLNSGHTVPPKPDYLPVLHPDGRLERYRIPDSYSLRNTTRLAVITRRGFVVTNEAIFVGALFPNKAQSGAYLIRGEQVVRLVPWLVGNERAALDNSHRGIAVSPDGCKLAFKHGEGERYKTAHTIKMIDVCQGE